MTEFDDPRPIRVMVFPTRPDVILIYVPEGEELWLPRMRSPFQRFDVAAKLGAVDIPARVSESVPGRFTTAVEKAINDERAERAQRQRENEAVRMAGVIADPQAKDFEKERAKLLIEKQEVDESVRKLKAEIGSVKAAAATRGEYLTPAKFRQLNERLSTAQARSLAIQARLSAIRKERREGNVLRQEGRDRRFIEHAKRRLPTETFQALWNAVDEDDEHE